MTKHENETANVVAAERGGLDEAQTSRAKPASYPAVSLSLCLKKARSIIEAQGADAAGEFQSPAVIASLAGYKGYESNSAPKGFLAALGHFGLLEKDPASRQARLARELRELDWTREGEISALVSRALRRPAIHQATLREFGSARVPDREALRSFLERRGLSARPAGVLAACMLDDWAMAIGCGAGRKLDGFPQGAVMDGAPVGQERAWIEARHVSLPSGNHARIIFDLPPSEDDWRGVKGSIRD